MQYESEGPNYREHIFEEFPQILYLLVKLSIELILFWMQLWSVVVLCAGHSTNFTHCEAIK